MLYFADDIVNARSLRSSLGCVYPSHQDLLSNLGQTTPESVAFELQFPILEGVPIATLLKMRRDELDLFSRLQSRLRTAVIERSSTQSAKGPKDIADEIRRDLIDPELQKIRTKLRASERVLAKKSVVGLALGSLATTCGIIAGMPIAQSLAGGVAATTAAAQSAASKHLEEKRDLALEDFYFLWKAVGHALGQR